MFASLLVTLREGLRGSAHRRRRTRLPVPDRRPGRARSVWFVVGASGCERRRGAALFLTGAELEGTARGALRAATQGAHLRGQVDAALTVGGAALFGLAFLDVVRERPIPADEEGGPPAPPFVIRVRQNPRPPYAMPKPSSAPAPMRADVRLRRRLQRLPCTWRAPVARARAHNFRIGRTADILPTRPSSTIPHRRMRVSRWSPTSPPHAPLLQSGARQ